MPRGNLSVAVILLAFVIFTTMRGSLRGYLKAIGLV